MGFESFRVELRGGSTTHVEVNKAIQKLDNVIADSTAIATPHSMFFIMNDGEHTIEIESIASPVKLSCRFTLCHPPSIDAVFLDFVRQLMSILKMEARVCDDVPKEHGRFFALDDFDEFSTVAKRSISLRRQEWVSAFGSEHLAATTSEAHAKIIQPHCQISASKKLPRFLEERSKEPATTSLEDYRQSLG